MHRIPSRVLVTGGGGFIGSHIVDALLEKGLQVGVLDDFSSGSEANLPKGSHGMEVHRGDILDKEFVAAVVGKYNAVVHEAARVSVTRSIEDPLGSNAVNIDGTLNLLEAARKSEVQRFVYASSSSVYGETETLPKRESMPPQPVSPYAVSKLAAEAYCRLYADLYGLKTISLRYFNVYGPRQRPGPYSGVIPTFMDAIAAGRRPKVYGDGSQSRDFTYVKDVVQANVLSLGGPVKGGEVFNVGSSSRTTIDQLATVMAKLMGKPDLKPEHAPERKGDVRHSFADISLISGALGYRPAYNIEKGLAETLGSFRA